MAPTDVNAYYQTYAVFVATPLVLLLLVYLIYRARKGRKRRAARKELVEQHPEMTVDYFAKHSPFQRRNQVLRRIQQERAHLDALIASLDDKSLVKPATASVGPYVIP